MINTGTNKKICVKDLCKLIMEGGRFGVAKLKFGGIEIVFHRPTANWVPQVINRKSGKATFAQPASLGETIDESMQAELERSQIMIDDAEAYEQMQIDELERLDDEARVPDGSNESGQ